MSAPESWLGSAPEPWGLHSFLRTGENQSFIKPQAEAYQNYQNSRYLKGNAQHFQWITSLTLRLLKKVVLGMRREPREGLTRILFWINMVCFIMPTCPSNLAFTSNSISMTTKHSTVACRLPLLCSDTLVWPQQSEHLQRGSHSSSTSKI